MLSHSNSNSEVVNHIIDIDDIKVKSILSIAKEIQRNLLNALNKSCTSHSSNFFESTFPAALMHKIKRACSKHLYSLDDIKELLISISDVKNDSNFSGPLREALNKIDIDQIDTAIHNASRDIHTREEYMLMILKHKKASMLVDPESRVYRYHQEQILRFKNLLINDYSNTFISVMGGGVPSKEDLQKVHKNAEDKVNDYLIELDEALLPLSPLRKKHYMDLQMLPYLTRRSVSENMPDAQKNKLIVFNTLLTQFTDYLKWEEKEFFYNEHLILSHDSSAKLRPTETEKRLEWMMYSLQEKIVDPNVQERLSASERFFKMQERQRQKEDEEVERIIAEEMGRPRPRKKTTAERLPIISYTDSLYTNSLMSDLKSIDVSSYSNAKALCKELDSTLEYFLEHHLEEKQFDPEQRLYIKKWKSHLINLFEGLKNELLNAEKLLNGERIHTHDDETFKTKLTRRIVDAVQPKALKSGNSPSSESVTTTISLSNDGPSTPTSYRKYAA